MKKILVLVLGMMIIGAGIVAAADEPPFQEGPEAQRQNQMWDLIPPNYSPNASYYIYGTPGGEGNTYREAQ